MRVHFLKMGFRWMTFMLKRTMKTWSRMYDSAGAIFEIFARSASEAIVNNEAPWMKTIAAEDSHLYLPVNAATSKFFRE